MLQCPAYLLPTVSLALLLAAGCGRTVTPGEPAEAGEEQVETPADAPGVGGAVARDPADDPAAAVDGWFAAFAEGRADGLVGAIPPQFRDDLDRWLVGWLRTVQPAERRAAAEALGNFARALREKQSFVLASDRVTIGGPAADFLREYFDPVCRVIETAADWPGWGEPVGSDSRELIAAVLGAIASEPALAERFRQLDATTRSRSGSSAVVTVARRGETGDQDLKLRLIDRRWVPVGLAERWDELRHFAASAESAEGGQLRHVTRFLNDMSVAVSEVTTQKEFDALADRAATWLLAAAAEADKKPRSVEPNELVTVAIEGPLTESEKDELLWRLVSLTDQPQSGLADASDREGGGMVVTVGPVADLQAFADRLPQLEILGVDAETKTITVRHAAP